MKTEYVDEDQLRQITLLEYLQEVHPDYFPRKTKHKQQGPRPTFAQIEARWKVLEDIEREYTIKNPIHYGQ